MFYKIIVIFFHPNVRWDSDANVKDGMKNVSVGKIYVFVCRRRLAIEFTLTRTPRLANEMKRKETKKQHIRRIFFRRCDIRAITCRRTIERCATKIPTADRIHVCPSSNVWSSAEDNFDAGKRISQGEIHYNQLSVSWARAHKKNNIVYCRENHINFTVRSNLKLNFACRSSIACLSLSLHICREFFTTPQMNVESFQMTSAEKKWIRKIDCRKCAKHRRCIKRHQ